MQSERADLVNSKEAGVISIKNHPANRESRDDDFTVAAYAELLSLAKRNYTFASYDDIPWESRFVLWRHDCDYSLNRAHSLACAEAEQDIQATYFLNLHSEFYNLFERGQHRLVREIIDMGHQIGLHFDAAFHGDPTEEQLSAQVRNEADHLQDIFGEKLAAFSFHNPNASHLHCEEEAYGGLINCYSHRFKAEVPYCSDSNGHWRFRRLRDVLESATDRCLQVLTHPGLWQKCAMPPRQRIFRSAYGRAIATMADYDAAISAHGRENLSGFAGAQVFLKNILPERHALLEYLWMSGEVATLFVELWRLHESQISKLCKAVLVREWQVPTHEVNVFFERSGLAIDGWRLFAGVFGSSWQAASGVTGDTYLEWLRLRNQLIHGRTTAPKQRLEAGCIILCEIIATLAAWGKSQPISYDGLVHLDTIGLQTYKTADGSLTERLEEEEADVADFSTKRWKKFKAEIQKSGVGKKEE